MTDLTPFPSALALLIARFPESSALSGQTSHGQTPSGHADEQYTDKWPTDDPSRLEKPSSYDHRPKSSEPSASRSAHPPHLIALALTVLHNLRHEHDWTDLRLHLYRSTASKGSDPVIFTEPHSRQDSSPLSHPHSQTHSPLQSDSPPQRKSPQTDPLLPRPMISGLPPQRLYQTPEQQAAMLAAERAGKHTQAARFRQAKREWVLPTHLAERWTLRRLAAVMDALPPGEALAEGGQTVDAQPSSSKMSSPDRLSRPDRASNPGGSNSESGLPARSMGNQMSEADQIPEPNQVSEPTPSSKQAVSKSEQDAEPKRVLLATAANDSTVVYYIVHDGIVKPRQN